MKNVLIVMGLAALAGCDAGIAPTEPAASENVENSGTVATSGKVETALADVPEAALASAKAAQPTMTFTEAAAEVRDGRNYFDIEGTLPDGSEIELDLMEDAGGWRVVETQRDIAFAEVPEAVRTTFASAETGFTPVRVIESRQDQAVTIYELFGPAQGDEREGTKIEVKYDGRTADLLTEEWAH